MESSRVRDDDDVWDSTSYYFIMQIQNKKEVIRNDHTYIILHTQIYAYIQTYIQHTDIHKYTYIHTYIYTYTHTNKYNIHIHTCTYS